MPRNHLATFLPAALLLAGFTSTPAIAAPPPTVVYGTTAQATTGPVAGGSTFNATATGTTTISGSDRVQFDDGTTISNNTINSTIQVDGSLDFNTSTGTFTLNNKIAGSGNLSVSGSGTVQLTGTSAGRVLPLNMTVTTSDGLLSGTTNATGAQTTIFQLGASGTGTLNVSGGVVSGSSWQVGVGSTGVGVVNVTGGTFGPIGALTVGGSSGGSGGTGTLNINGGVVGDNPTTPLNSGGFRFGVGVNSSGVATITSGTLRATSIATVDGATGSFIGLAGTGNVTLNSGYLQAGHLTLGNATTGRGVLNIVSGSASTNNLIIGASGNGTMEITGGMMKSGGGFLGNATSGTGTVSVTSGTWLVNGNGLGGESLGVLRVGGTSGGTGNLTIGTGGYVVVSGSFIRGANGTFSLNQGGTLQIGGQSGVYTPSTATGTASSVGSGTMGVLVGDLNYAGTLKFAQNNNSGTMASSTYSGNLSGSGDLVKTGTGTITLSGSNSYTGGTTVTGGKLALGSANAIGTTGNITFNGGSLQATANNTQDYSSRFSTAANQQYSVDSNGQDLTLAANLTSANGSFTKLGSGNITLTGANSFTSGSAAAGVLIGNATSLATSGTFTANSSAEVRFNQTAPNQTWAGAMVGTGTFTKLGAGTLTLTGSTSGTTGTLLVSEGAVKGTTDNIRRIVVNNSQVTFDQTTSGTYSQTMSGTGNLLLSNSGTVTFSGTNTISGTATVAGGRLIASRAQAMPGQVVNNSAVEFSGSTSGTYSGNMSGSGSLTKTGTSTITMTGSNSYLGGTTVSAGRLVGTTSSLQGPIANNAAVTFDQATNGTYLGVMSGTGNLTKSGAGALTLSGNNSYSGGTIVSAGSLIGTTSSLQGAITNNAAVTFDQASDGSYSGNMSGSGSLAKSGAGAVTLSGNNSYSGGTTVSAGSLIGTTSSLQGAITNNAAVTFDQATNGTYLGVMSGTGNLTKSGAGALTLSGNNTYSGNTVVDAGELQVNGSIASSAVTVKSGASLSGSGSVGTISGAGSINPGNSPGILTAGSIDPSLGMFLNFEITALEPNYAQSSNSTNDLLRLTSTSPFTASLTDANQINLYFNLASLEQGSYLGGIFIDQPIDFLAMVSGATFNAYVQDATGTVTYNGVTYSALGGGLSMEVSTVNATANFVGGNVDGRSMQFSIVPEPSTALLAAFGLLAAFFLLRKRKSCG